MEAALAVYFGKECPVCRTRLSALRTFFRPAWSQWRCAGCESLIAIGTIRRLLLIGFYSVLLVGSIYLLRQSPLPQVMVMAALIPLGLLGIALLDRIVVVERRGLHCPGCGYDVRGAPDRKCPECGRAIDESLHRRAVQAEDLLRTGPSAAARWGILVAVLLLCGTLLAVGLTIHLRALRQAAPPPVRLLFGALVPLPVEGLRARWRLTQGPPVSATWPENSGAVEQ